jgi:hypothetical protein
MKYQSVRLYKIKLSQSFFYNCKTYRWKKLNNVGYVILHFPKYETIFSLLSV